MGGCSTWMLSFDQWKFTYFILHSKLDVERGFFFFSSFSFHFLSYRWYYFSVILFKVCWDMYRKWSQSKELVRNLSDVLKMKREKKSTFTLKIFCTQAELFCTSFWYQCLRIGQAGNWISPLLSLAVPRLIELCRSPTERNNSDSVLVACLVSVKRVSMCQLNYFMLWMQIM